jgi:DNA-binding NarL/FixJ family response regulator
MVDNEVLVIDLMKRHFDARPKSEVIFVGAVHSNGDDLLQRVRETRATIVLVHASLALKMSRTVVETQGVDAARRIRAEFGGAVSIILMSKDPSFEQQLQRAGADCYVSKLAPLEHLTRVIDALRRHTTPVSSTPHQVVDVLRVDFRLRAIKLGNHRRLGEWKPLQPAPLVLVGYLAEERARGGEKWLEKLSDGSIGFAEPATWNKFSEWANARKRSAQIDAVHLTNMKFKVSAVAHVDLIEGPPPGPGSGPRHYRLIGSIAPSGIDIVGLGA